MRRPLLALVFIALTAISQAQSREGAYKPEGGTPSPWTINEHQTLIWAGQPYLPTGVRIDGTVQAVSAAKAAGITDVIVDVPVNGVGWDEVLAALNQAKMRFLLRINSLAPTARGFAVEPQGYRVSGIVKSRDVTLDIPGAKSAFVVLATKSDANIIDSGRVSVVDGRLTYFAKVGPEIEHILLVYPEMTSIDQPDYWDDLDSERDELLGSLRKHALGPGLRGIVNPIGRSLPTAGKEPRFVPTNPYFRMEFSAFLEEKYKNVETVMKSWSMSGSSLTQVDDKTRKWLATFDDLARLIPLWTTTRGISAMLDPDTNKLFMCDDHLSQAWADITQVINAAGDRRFSRLVPAIHSIADVPVLQDWLGWIPPVESKQPAIDGLGLRCAGTTASTIAESGCRAASSILRWNTQGWLVATDVDLGTAEDAATQVSGVLDDVSSMGARGIFVRAETAAVLRKVADEARQRSTDTSLAGQSVIPVFFPENAYNPAVPQRLPGGHWWLPTPSDGNRIDLGSKFYAYRSALNEGTFTLWAHTPGRYKLHLLNPKSIRFQTIDGSDPMPKITKDMVEVTLSEFPLMISGTQEVPVPDIAAAETIQEFRQMLAIGERNHGGIEEEQMRFNDAMIGFERNPGGSFDLMRKEFWKLAAKLATYTWIEAERYTDTNFSEVVLNPGCSGGRALSLRTLVPPSPGGYFAEYRVQVRSKDDQQVWIAAKIPVERRNDVSVIVGGQRMKIGAEPLSIYGGGYAWYKLGTTRVAGNLATIRLQVDSAGNSEIGVDAILLTPGEFKPNGVTPPDPINFHSTPTERTKNLRRRGSGGS